MDMKIAIEICRNYGNGHGIDSFLETLQEMKIQKQRNNLAIITEKAFDTVMKQGAEFFAPA
jgi:hypothetical protein